MFTFRQWPISQQCHIVIYRILQSTKDKLRSRLQRHGWNAILSIQVAWRATLLKFLM